MSAKYNRHTETRYSTEVYQNQYCVGEFNTACTRIEDKDGQKSRSLAIDKDMFKILKSEGQKHGENCESDKASVTVWRERERER